MLEVFMKIFHCKQLAKNFCLKSFKKKTWCENFCLAEKDFIEQIAAKSFSH